ncbi:MAG: polymerase subunit epsilon, partial [Pseudomonadota bacterium]|nr:polymerase subunit epsilon [Pseudomonadota bacterium]
SGKIQEITGLTDVDLAGKSIDWHHVMNILMQSDYVACHNSGFDRKFLEAATPNFIQAKIRQLPFGCTLNGIDWKNRGFLSQKLVDLNSRLKFRYPAHRALNDCWATINLLQQIRGALNELIAGIHQDKTLIFVTGTTYKQSTDLSSQGFSYSSGENEHDKYWYKYEDVTTLPATKRWLDRVIYKEEGSSDRLSCIEHISPCDRYSIRANFSIAQLSSMSIFSRTKQKTEDRDEYKLGHG